MALKKRNVNPKSQCCWQMSEIINRNLATVYREGAHTSLQTSPVWLSGWKSHNRGLAVDISNVSWVWLHQEHHKIVSLSSVVFLYFRFHNNHEVKGSGKQNKENEKENRKGIWRMTSAVSKDLVWFSWQVSWCSWTNLSALCPSHPLTFHSARSHCRDASPGHPCGFGSVGSNSNEERWQAMVNLLWEPINLQWKRIWWVSHAFVIRPRRAFGFSCFSVLFCVVFLLCKDDLFCWNAT